MSIQNQRIILWILLIVLAVPFYSITHYSEQFSELLYLNQNYDFLNRISGIEDIRPFDFYRGKLEDVLWGPVKSVISGTLFLCFCWIYMRKFHVFKFLLAIIVYLILSRYQVLFFPPYGESIIGPFSDAIWLVRHNLDYAALTQQDTFLQGGPQIYPTSLFTLLLAYLIHFTPTVKSFLVSAHLITFFFGAVIVTLFRYIFLKIFQDEDIALLGSLVILAHPIFQTNAEFINMEMTCLIFAALSIFFLIKDRFPLAGIMAVCSLMMKAPGALICGSVFFAGFMLLFTDQRWPKKLFNLFWGIFAVACALIKGVIRNHMIGGSAPYNEIKLFTGWKNFLFRPYLTLFALSLVILLGLIIAWFIKNKNDRSFGTFIKEHYAVLLLFATASFWYIIYLNFSVLNPRYILLVLPFFIFCLIYIFIRFAGKGIFAKGILIVVILICFLAAHGIFYDQYVENTISSYNIYERSLEYRNDLKIHQMVVEELQKHYPGYRIGAPFTVALTLIFHEIGYVDKPLDVMVYGMKANHEGLLDFTGIQDINIPQTIWIGFRNSRIIPEIPYPIGPLDRVVKEIDLGEKKILLFQGGFAVEKMRLIIELNKRGLLEKFSNK